MHVYSLKPSRCDPEAVDESLRQPVSLAETIPIADRFASLARLGLNGSRIRVIHVLHGPALEQSRAGEHGPYLFGYLNAQTGSFSIGLFPDGTVGSGSLYQQSVLCFNRSDYRYTVHVEKGAMAGNRR